MDAWVWIVVAAIVVLAAIVFLIVRRQQQRREWRDWFPGYERSVQSERRRQGSRRRAEGELARRTRRRQELKIRPLTQAARARYSAQWNELQGRFVDRPQIAVVQADDLITQVMRDRGYPVDDFESQSELVSVDHPDVVQNYRDAHGVYTKITTGEASTEELRRAVMSYRVLFAELVADDTGSDDLRRS